MQPSSSVDSMLGQRQRDAVPTLNRRWRLRPLLQRVQHLAQLRRCSVTKAKHMDRVDAPILVVCKAEKLELQ